jgi:hypothetical protein
MDNKTRVWLQSMVGDYIMEEKSFTMGDLIGGLHLKWCKDQADPDGLAWINCSAERGITEM